MTPAFPADPRPTELLLEGRRLSYSEEGDPQGHPLLFVHGLPGSHRDWRWLASALLALPDPPFRLLRLDMPGFGGSELELAGPGIGELSAFLVRVMDALALQDLTLVAHSFGTPQAIAAATDPRVSALALLAPIGLRPHQAYRAARSPELLDALSRVPLLGPAVIDPMFLRALIGMGFPRTTPLAAATRCIRMLGQFSFSDHAARCARLQVPTLLAWTGDDRMVEPAVVEELERGLPAGPRLRFEAGGHNLQKSQAVELAQGLRALRAQARGRQAEASG